MALGTDATRETTALVRACFDRLERGQLGAPREGYAPDARITIHGTLHDATREEGRKGEPRLAPDECNHDTERARASMRRLAAREPATAWPAHGDALTGDVARRLERAAALA
jgi:hypothetical protein